MGHNTYRPDRRSSEHTGFSVKGDSVHAEPPKAPKVLTPKEQAERRAQEIRNQMYAESLRREDLNRNARRFLDDKMYFDAVSWPHFPFVFNSIYPLVNQYERALAVTAAIYMVGLFVAMWIVGKICHFLVPVGLVALKLYSPYQGLLIVPVLALWVFYRLMYMFTKEKKPKDAMDIYADIFRPIPQAERDGFRLRGAHMDLIWFAGLMWFVTSKYASDGLVMVAPIMVFYFLTRLMPGVGGNSTSGILTMVLLLIVSITFLPQSLKATIATFQDITRVAAQETMMAGGKEVNPATIALTWWGALEWVGLQLGLGLNGSSVLDVMRMLVGELPLLWLIIDDWIGPGKAIQQTSVIRAKNKAEFLSGMAGIYASCNWAWALVYVVVCIVTGSTLRLLSFLFMVCLTYHLWKLWGEPDWQSRGQAATMTDGRTGFLYVFGDGPGGKRQLILYICLTMSSVLLVLRRFNNMTCLYSMIALLTLRKERYAMTMLGILTLNVGLIGQAWQHKKPMTHSLEESAVDAANVEREPG